MKGEAKISLANGIRKQAGVSILIAGKIDFKSKLARGDKDSHFILIKGTAHQGNVPTLNTCTKLKCT